MNNGAEREDGFPADHPRVMDKPFDPSTLPRWPGERVARTLRLLHLADDLAGLFVAYVLAYVVRFGFELDALRVLYGKHLERSYAIAYGIDAWWYFGAFAVFLVLLYALFGLYDGHMRLRRTPLMWTLLHSNAIVLVTLSTYLYFNKNTWHMRGFLPLVLLLNVPCTYAMRRITNAVVKRFRNRDRLLYRSILIGKGREADYIWERSQERHLKGHRIIDRFETPATPAAAAEELKRRLADKPSVSTVFLVDPTIQSPVCSAILDVIRRSNRAAVIYSPQFLRLHNPFEYGDRLFGVPLVHYAAPGTSFAPSTFRNFLSRLFAAVLLVPAAPFLLVVAAAIRLETPGPALFVQERTGLGGRRFRMFKFRTMVNDAEARLAALKSENESDGALFKMHDDPRLTKLGRFLRHTSIDELPQLINIARGEMRFVGPRPLPCKDIEPFLPYWHGFRQTVPPGLTCIWQCSGRSDVGFNAMSMLDVWYALNRSWLLDARIVVRTFWTVVFGGGAY